MAVVGRRWCRQCLGKKACRWKWNPHSCGTCSWFKPWSRPWWQGNTSKPAQAKKQNSWNDCVRKCPTWSQFSGGPQPKVVRKQSASKCRRWNCRCGIRHNAKWNCTSMHRKHWQGYHRITVSCTNGDSRQSQTRRAENFRDQHNWKVRSAVHSSDWSSSTPIDNSRGAHPSNQDDQWKSWTFPRSSWDSSFTGNVWDIGVLC